MIKQKKEPKAIIKIKRDSKVKVAKQLRLETDCNDTLLQLKEMEDCSESKVFEKFLKDKRILFDLVENIMNVLSNNPSIKLFVESKQDENIGLYFNKKDNKDSFGNGVSINTAYKRDTFIIYINSNNDILIQHNIIINVMSIENNNVLFSTNYTNPPSIIKDYKDMYNYFKELRYNNLKIKENKEMV